MARMPVCSYRSAVADVGDDDGLCIVPHDDFPAVVEACIRAHTEEEGLLSLVAASRDVPSLIEKLKGDAPD